MIIFDMEARIVTSKEAPVVQKPAAGEGQPDAVCSRCGNYIAELIYGGQQAQGPEGPERRFMDARDP